MPTVQINGLALHYELTGDGPPLLLLHGLGSSADDWALQVPVFSEHYQVIAMDLRGHGQSRAEGLRYSMTQLAQDVAALLAHLDLPPVHVVGLSLGGCTAQVLAAQGPERVRSLVLVNTFARLRPAGRRGAGRFLKRLWLIGAASMPAVAVYVAAELFPKPEQQPIYAEAVRRLSRNSRRSYLASMLAVAGFDSRSLLSRIRCPVLVMAGDRDTTVPRSAVEALCRGIAGARLVLIEDSGHATPYDQPEKFNKIVLDFIDGVERGESSLRSA